MITSTSFMKQQISGPLLGTPWDTARFARSRKPGDPVSPLFKIEVMHSVMPCGSMTSVQTRGFFWEFHFSSVDQEVIRIGV